MRKRVGKSSEVGGPPQEKLEQRSLKNYPQNNIFVDGESQFWYQRATLKMITSRQITICSGKLVISVFTGDAFVQGSYPKQPF